MGFVRYLPVVVQLALLVYCLIDCIQTDSLLVRNLPKTLWIFLMILLPVIGCVAWLVAGRPQRDPAPRTVPWPSTATAGFPEYERPRPPKGPDDDPGFLADLAADSRHERMLAEWEAQLREREERLGRGGVDGQHGAEPDAAHAGPDGATPRPDGAPPESDQGDPAR